jgi:hypothetical protein
MQTIRKISLASAFKVGAILQTLMFILYMIIILIFQLLILLLGALGAISGGGSGLGDLGIGGGMMLIIWIVALIGGSLASLILGGILGFLTALFYNTTANITGGLEVQIDN